MTSSRDFTSPGYSQLTSPRLVGSSSMLSEQGLVYQGVQSVFYSVSPRESIPPVMTEEVAPLTTVATFPAQHCDGFYPCCPSDKTKPAQQTVSQERDRRAFEQQQRLRQSQHTSHLIVQPSAPQAPLSSGHRLGPNPTIPQSSLPHARERNEQIHGSTTAGYQEFESRALAQPVQQGIDDQVPLAPFTCTGSYTHMSRTLDTASGARSRTRGAWFPSKAYLFFNPQKHICSINSF